VIGELVGNSMYQEGRTNPDGTPIGFSRNTSIAVAGLSGSLASAFTSIALGDDDSKVAKNVYAGNFVGTNAAANNSTLVDKKGKILDVVHDKNEDGTDDLGVYVDNQNGGTNKDQYIGKTDRWNEFIIPETGAIPDPIKNPAYIHIDKSLDSYVKSLAEMGGVAVGQEAGTIFYPKDLINLGLNSMNGGTFDIKSSSLLGGPFDGYLLNGSYVTTRSAGNFLAGYNSTMAGMSPEITMKASGAVQVKDAVMKGNFGTIPTLGNAPYYGEIPYAGERIMQGIKDAQQRLNSTTKH